MELRKNCELVEVVYKSEGKKAVMTFLDEEMGQVLEVNFNRQSYENDKFVDDPEKAKKVDEWCEKYFDTDFEGLADKVGVKKDIYKYENFNALWETQETAKFTKDDVGKFFETEITRVTDDGKGIHIYFENEDKEYESKMMYADYIEAMKKWFENPQKKAKRYDEFKTKFGIDIEDRDEIVGKKIMVEVKLAFGKFPYAEIKKPSWK